MYFRAFFLPIFFLVVFLSVSLIYLKSSSRLKIYTTVLMDEAGRSNRNNALIIIPILNAETDNSKGKTLVT